MLIAVMLASGPCAAGTRLAIDGVRWTINGRDLETYFPNRVHQQIVNEPFVTLGQEGRYDVIARMSGGGVSGQAGAGVFRERDGEPLRGVGGDRQLGRDRPLGDDNSRRTEGPGGGTARRVQCDARRQGIPCSHG